MIKGKPKRDIQNLEVYVNPFCVHLLSKKNNMHNPFFGSFALVATIQCLYTDIEFKKSYTFCVTVHLHCYFGFIFTIVDQFVAVHS
jgi:hypothetical protein